MNSNDPKVNAALDELVSEAHELAYEMGTSASLATAALLYAKAKGWVTAEEHDCAVKFHDVAVRERDAERAARDGMQATLRRYEDERAELVEALRDIARGDYSDPCQRTPEDRARAVLAKVHP